MSAKFVIFFAFVTVASAGILQGAYYPQPAILKQVVHAAPEAHLKPTMISTMPSMNHQLVMSSLNKKKLQTVSSTDHTN